MRISSFLDQLARFARWHRRSLAALAAGLAVLCALTVMRPASAPVTEVVVAAHALAAGQQLTADDLTSVGYQEGTVPEGAVVLPADAVGRVVAAPLTRGTPITEASTISSTLTPNPGELLVPFHLADPGVAPLVRVGDRVTVVGAGQDGTPVTLAERVRVAALPQPVTTPGGALGGSSTSGEAGLVVVACDRDTAKRLAAWSGNDGLSIALG